jgi:ribonucleoside-diphosphate reductase alpha chain
MDVKAKYFVTDEGLIDLSTHVWDDQLFSDLLVRKNSMDQEQAMSLSRFVRTAISDLGIHQITSSVVDEVLKAKMTDLGLKKIRTVKIDKNLFIRNGVPLSENARAVLERRYLKKDKKGIPTETPVQMFRRVARFIAEAETKFDGTLKAAEAEELFYDLMADLKFFPNSPTLMNAGRELGQLAACFVLPVEDSLEGIFEALKNAAVIHKSGGGTGFSFSRLRPQNSMVGTTGGIASGPVSFMKIFNTATEQVKQGGTRRGANMAILRVDHPDIMEFIHCKQDNGDFNNFNISVGLTEAFMDAAKKGEPYDLINPETGQPDGSLDAGEVYQTLVNQAWSNGDPGIVFLDRLNRDNPTPEIGEIESTNPCGEQPLLPMEACNLGSINLAKFVLNNGNTVSIDYEDLAKTVTSAVRFLDNTIEMSKYPLPAIEKMVKGNRKIGLGVMGFADLLFRLGIPYCSEQALETAESIMEFIQTTSHEASVGLAKERGVFKNYNKSIFKGQKQSRYRNATTTTIAPTGTLSIIAGCSSGVEPLFALSFVRNVMDNDKLVEVNPYFETIARERGFYSAEMLERITEEGSLAHIEEIPEDVKEIFVTAHDISPEWHVKMQAAFQKQTDNAVSKTVNLPRDATVEDVRKIYDLAHELDCKGVTIYRDGSKENQVLSYSKEVEADTGVQAAVKKRPETLEGFTTKIRTGMGMLYVTVTEFNGHPFEVFATIGKSGRSTTAKTEAIGRLVSLAFRAGVKVDKVVEQLMGIGGEHPVFQEGGLVLSIPDAIGRVLERRYMKEGHLPKGASDGKFLGNECPECGQTISFEEGCAICHACGFTKCG